MTETMQTAVLGAGVIGASWTALFQAHGHDVAVFDPDPEAPARVRAMIDGAAPTLAALGVSAAPGRVRFCTDAAAAVAGAGFVQECVPERLEMKHALFAEIEPHLAPRAVVASSASGLMLSEMQPGWRDPSRLVLGHPFNPPH